MQKHKWSKRLASILAVIALIVAIQVYVGISSSNRVYLKVMMAKNDVPPRTEISAKMLVERSMPEESVPPNAIRDPEEIIGKYTVAGYGVSKNSFFFEEKLTTRNSLPDEGIMSLEENEVAFPLLVDLESSLGNSIIPETEVDLYFSTKVRASTLGSIAGNVASDEVAIFGKVVSKARVLSVRNADAANVFEPQKYLDGKEGAEPSASSSLAKIFIFAIPQELNDRVNKAKLLGDILPIAAGDGTMDDNDTNAAIEYINSASISDE